MTIVVEQLTKRYGSKVAVDDLSFGVRPGVVTGFLGPNGSGKSTTMRCMLGLDHPNAGGATFNGRAYRSIARPLHEVGALLDAGDVHPARTGRNHLRYLAATHKISNRRVDQMLEEVGIASAARKPVRTYSLGMRQRLGLAAVMLGDPHTVVLDEPGNGLDPEGIRWVRDYLGSLAHQGRTILVSSHLLAEMALMATDLVVIGQGRLVEVANVTDFVAHHGGTRVRVASPQIERLRAALVADHGDNTAIGIEAVDATTINVTGIEAARIGETAAALGVVLHALSDETGSLEDSFLHATAHRQEYRTQTMGDAAGVRTDPLEPPTSPDHS
jgi:ABC-2 type transport system ATP-binding protein